MSTNVKPKGVAAICNHPIDNIRSNGASSKTDNKSKKPKGVAAICNHPIDNILNRKI